VSELSNSADVVPGDDQSRAFAEAGVVGIAEVESRVLGTFGLSVTSTSKLRDHAASAHAGRRRPSLLLDACQVFRTRVCALRRPEAAGLERSHKASNPSHRRCKHAQRLSERT